MCSGDFAVRGGLARAGDLDLDLGGVVQAIDSVALDAGDRIGDELFNVDRFAVLAECAVAAVIARLCAVDHQSTDKRIGRNGIGRVDLFLAFLEDGSDISAVHILGQLNGLAVDADDDLAVIAVGDIPIFRAILLLCSIIRHRLRCAGHIDVLDHDGRIVDRGLVACGAAGLEQLQVDAVAEVDFLGVRIRGRYVVLGSSRGEEFAVASGIVVGGSDLHDLEREGIAAIVVLRRVGQLKRMCAVEIVIERDDCIRIVGLCRYSEGIAEEARPGVIADVGDLDIEVLLPLGGEDYVIADAAVFIAVCLAGLI